MKRKSTFLLSVLAVLLVFGMANSNKAYSELPVIEVVEQNVIFQSGDIEAKVGQTIRLINKDPFMHMSQIRKLNNYDIEGESVAGQAEVPNSTVDLSVAEPGKYKLRCIFHDGMIINVNVTR